MLPRKPGLREKSRRFAWKDLPRTYFCRTHMSGLCVGLVCDLGLSSGVAPHLLTGGTAGWLGRGGRSSPTTFSSTSFKNTYSELEQWVCCACGVSR